MIINDEEYITWEQLELLKKIYQTPSLKPHFKRSYPKKSQDFALFRQSQEMTIESFLVDESGFFRLTFRHYNPQRAKKGDYEKSMNPEPSFLNEYGEALYLNPFAYQHVLPKGEFRIY